MNSLFPGSQNQRFSRSLLGLKGVRPGKQGAGEPGSLRAGKMGDEELGALNVGKALLLKRKNIIFL